MFFSTIKGWLGEKMTTFGMWIHLDARIYHRVHDVIVPCANGTTQIDHILVSVFGVFVIETKNMNGWIFGNETQEKWTQVVFGKKYPFQNPLRQNYRHTKALSEYLGIKHDFFRSVVFFIGDCEFKTPMPGNVLERGLSAYVQSFRQQCFTHEEVDRILTKLAGLKQSGAQSRADHVYRLQTRYGSTTVCPKCGSQLVKRHATKGQYAGREFLGCSGYPKCRYIHR